MTLRQRERAELEAGKQAAKDRKEIEQAALAAQRTRDRAASGQDGEIFSLATRDEQLSGRNCSSLPSARVKLKRAAAVCQKMTTRRTYG